MMLTKVLHGAAFHVDASLLIEVNGPCLIRPIGSVEAATLGSLFDPVLDRRHEVLGNPPGFAGCPVNVETVKSSLMIML